MGIVAPQAPPTEELGARAKCEYCGRYGEFGQCAGCGAPNRPFRRIEVTTMSAETRQYIEVWE